VSRARWGFEVETMKGVGEVAEVEVLARPERRRFTVDYKRRIVREADACKGVGEIGALLRREGLYSSHLSAWRAARDRGELAGSGPRKRGPVPTPPDPRDKRIVELERENRKLTRRAERAEALVEVQKKVSELLGIQLDRPDEKS
jgi:transposase-like protein